eukprot:5375712-Pyramimonas_sp.AAC.1
MINIRRVLLLGALLGALEARGSRRYPGLVRDSTVVAWTTVEERICGRERVRLREAPHQSSCQVLLSASVFSQR